MRLGKRKMVAYLSGADDDSLIENFSDATLYYECLPVETQLRIRALVDSRVEKAAPGTPGEKVPYAKPACGDRDPALSHVREDNIGGLSYRERLLLGLEMQFRPYVKREHSYYAQSDNRRNCVAKATA